MKKTTLGFALVLIGLLTAVYTGINFITIKRVVEIGAIHIDRQQNHLVQWSPFAGALFFITGIILIAKERKIKS
jgi:hypothetical protein